MTRVKREFPFCNQRIVPRDRTVFTLESEYRRLLGLSSSYGSKWNELQDSTTLDFTSLESESKEVNNIEVERKHSVKLFDRSTSDELEIMKINSGRKI